MEKGNTIGTDGRVNGEKCARRTTPWMHVFASLLKGPETLALVTVPSFWITMAIVAVPVCPCVQARTAGDSGAIVLVTC